MTRIPDLIVSAALLGTTAALAAKEPIPPERRVIRLTPAEEKAAQDFEARLKDYVALHRKLEAQLPKLGKDATPPELDKNQRALGAAIKAQRASAKRGDLFAPGIEALVKRTVKAVLAGPDGKTIE